MSQFPPLVIESGQVRQFASGDTLVGGTISKNCENINAGTITKCTPIYSYDDAYPVGGDPFFVDKAKADVFKTSKVIGLAIADAATEAVVQFQSTGTFAATTAQWDAVTGGTGGLNLNTIYYLSPTGEGLLTTTPPSRAGQFLVPVGIGISDTEMVLNIKQPAEVDGGDLSIHSGPRNILINGNFQFWQRGTSVAIANDVFLADRWKLVTTCTATGTMERSTDVPDTGVFCPYSLLINLSGADAAIGANDAFDIRQIVEGFTWARLKRKNNITISFWVKSTRTGIFSSYLMDSAAAYSYVVEHSVLVANTWEKKTATIPWPVLGTYPETNALAAYFGITLAAGANLIGAQGAWRNETNVGGNNQENFLDNAATDFRIAQVQIEPGCTVSPFELVAYEDELQRCQRFYCKSFPIDVAPVQNVGDHIGSVYWQAHIPSVPTYALAVENWPVRMRATPVMTWYNPVNASADARNMSQNTNVAITAGYNSDRKNVFSCLSVAQDSFSVHYAASAEF